MFFWNSFAFDDPADVGNLISGSSAFSKTSLNIRKFTVHVLLKPSLENFEHYFTSVWDECNCSVVWAFFGIVFLWGWNENWPFPVLWPLLSFPNVLAYWVAALSQHHLSGFEIAQLDPGLGGENCFIRRVLINSTYVVFFPRLCHGAAHLRLENGEK